MTGRASATTVPSITRAITIGLATARREHRHGGEAAVLLEARRPDSLHLGQPAADPGAEGPRRVALLAERVVEVAGDAGALAPPVTAQIPRLEAWLIMPRTYLGLTDEAPDVLRPPDGRYDILTADDLLNQPPPEPLIEHLIAKRNFVVVYGAPGMAKTFLSIHFALCVATGEDCFGRRTWRGPILYITAEGEAGFQQRVKAWVQAHPDAPELTNAFFITEAVNLLDEKSVNALIDQFSAMKRPPVFIIFDTLARCMVGGDENSAKDVGLAIAAIDRIRKAFEATALVIHHTGKKTNTERGSSALRGGADSMFQLKRIDGVLTLLNTKQKHGRKQKDLELILETIELGEIDESCVIECDVIDAFTNNEQKVLTILDRHREGLTFSEIETKTKLVGHSVGRPLKSLYEASFVRRPTATRGGRYRLTDLAIRTLSQRNSSASAAK
jgi:hypothetical protein